MKSDEWESKRLYILGRNPDLSLAELISLHNSQDIPMTVYAANEFGVIIESYTEKNKKNHISIRNSGSILKKCKIIAECYYPYNEEWIIQNLKEFMDKYLFIDNKGFWTVNFYNEESNPETLDIYDEVVDIMASLIKHFLPKTKAFYKTELPPIELNKKKIIETGIEIVIFFLEDKYYLCTTEEVIDILDFNNHDKNRPETTELEQIGGALARSMINLVSLNENKFNHPIWDTFCGIGTIPQEARFMGLKSQGSDINENKIELSKKNLEWFKRSTLYSKYFKPASPKDYFTMDIINPLDNLDFNGNIVSEPDLLEPLKYYPPLEEAKRYIRTFTINYEDYLNGIKKIIKDGVTVLVFPRIHCDDDSTIRMNIESMLQSRGFEILTYKNYLKNEKETPAIFIHSWKGQIIEREIVVFRKIN